MGVGGEGERRVGREMEVGSNVKDRGARETRCRCRTIDWFAAGDGTSPCDPCDVGSGTDSARRSCDECPAGKFERQSTRTGENFPAAWASAGGLADCTPFVEGEVKGSLRASCSECAPGWHALYDRPVCWNWLPAVV
mgnify:CR=1 FL=1